MSVPPTGPRAPVISPSLTALAPGPVTTWTLQAPPLLFQPPYSYVTLPMTHSAWHLIQDSQHLHKVLTIMGQTDSLSAARMCSITCIGRRPFHEVTKLKQLLSLTPHNRMKQSTKRAMKGRRSRVFSLTSRLLMRFWA